MTAAEFRARHRPGHPLLLPNAWDLASAGWLVADGFDVVGTTSLGVAAVAALPDGAGLTADATFALARRLTSACITVTVDIESGFSEDVDEIAGYAARLAALGVVGVNIEDSGPDGNLVDPSIAAARITAIVDAAPELFVNARADAFWVGGDAPREERLVDARGRLAAYERAGASGAFVPGVLDPTEVRELVESTALPMNVLVQPPGGLDVAALARLGVARISTGSLLVRAALGAMTSTMRAVREGTAPPALDVPGYEVVQAHLARPAG
ncbi:isocitrate lyase/phosphoenolpyruvate mutase family protein [Agromyces sp. CFH 90414]|uniref:Isocitrate lyase/phosphoenolpyruvate mutase family protein n=1 Tax=Agromyces agglutinans TaxID=2662258 RepID=A0A6I2FGS0_9MICO|nr:isocitrate lyase/phosphoenolpyruvate mutase family protein [Agromyces agglutinans]